jgi:hypothetical protein
LGLDQHHLGVLGVALGEAIHRVVDLAVVGADHRDGQPAPLGQGARQGAVIRPIGQAGKPIEATIDEGKERGHGGRILASLWQNLENREPQ